MPTQCSTACVWYQGILGVRQWKNWMPCWRNWNTLPSRKVMTTPRQLLPPWISIPERRVTLLRLQRSLPFLMTRIPFREIQEPKASPPASKTSAAAQLDELMARLCEMQHQVIHALGQAWHPEHFVCAHCKGEIGSSPFFERSGLAYCAEDYHRLFSPRCAYCAAPILDKVLTAMNQTWHPEHFFCAHCGEVFGEEGFHEKDKKPYCRKDFLGMFAPRCGGCNRPVLENYLSAMGTVWHPECFVCRVGTLPYLLRFGRGRALLSGVQLDCFSGFSTGSFFELDGRPFCELHYHRRRGTLCHGCGQPITGRCISAMGYRFHPEHFTCAFCLTQLSKGVFKEQNDKTYCHPCFNKLFPV
ncbi:leupaxin isoform X5 [Cervus canadensis]|uniref:leupaxin isoform X5 n=1 Tax=Cervus canadensis TaxID=1574408 RepID=UPI001C9E3A47|nr:leupaxin isoform X5 [Cervus canadensis]